MALKNPNAYNPPQEQFHDSLTGPNESGGSRPVYLLEHLATFTVNKEKGIIYPADGMRRLLRLEKTNGIWSQKMKLCLDGPWVLIMNYESGSVMERFAASSIYDPTPFVSNDPMEMYNNILAFVVAGHSGTSPSEMHIFQCHDVSAQDLADDLALISGNKAGNDRRISQSGRYDDNNSNRDFIMERERDKERQQGDKMKRNQIPHFANYRDPSDSELNPHGHNEDEASSTSSDKLYEQDIAILNRCFDDIEKFIARLQHAAAASRELERRKRSRKNSKKQTDTGEGMLSLRTRPPPEAEFYDIFQKFKLSFNLLSKLKSHIHDPNAPELVHFLFTPLALIVDASHETCAEPRLASQVIQPLLTRETINLLTNCVTSKETELWHSLGDAWLIPRDQWKTHVPRYQPVFMDGWSPDFPVIDEIQSSQPQSRSSQRRSDASSSTFHQQRLSMEDTRDDPYNRDQYSSYSRNNIRMTEIPLRSLDLDSDSAGSSPSRELPPNSQLDARRITPDNDDLGQAWAEDVVSRGGRVVRVTYPRTANNDKELTVVRGEYLEVLDDSRKWWKARNRHGMTAHVPHTIVAAHAPQDVFSNPLYSTQDNARGGSASPREAPSSSTSAPPVAPPLPPPPEEKPIPPKSPTPSKYNTLSSKSVYSLGGDDMQDELKMVLTLRDKRGSLVFLKTPDLFINQTSSASEVQEWLEVKAFDEEVRKKFRGVSGKDIFRLPRSTMEEMAGDKEGRRLYSQLLVQKNVSGYKTTSTKELAAVLQKLREKAES